MSLGLFALANDNANTFYDFVTFIYKRQSEVYNEAFLHKTHHNLIQLVAKFAYEHSGVDKEKFITTIANNAMYIQARTTIRYVATKSV